MGSKGEGERVGPQEAEGSEVHCQLAGPRLGVCVSEELWWQAGTLEGTLIACLGGPQGGEAKAGQSSRCASSRWAASPLVARTRQTGTGT